MKLRKLEIEGLRGAGKRLPLSLPEGGLFVFGENGLGKTTIADAIELLLSGEIPGYKREGCSLSAAIHLDTDRAIVEAELRDSGQKLRRALSGDQAGDLEDITGGEGQSVEVPELPLLRHSTVRNFVSQTSGEKRKAVLDLLGLLPLSGFRDTLKAAANDAKDARKVAERLQRDEAAVLERQLDGAGLLAKAEELRESAGLQTPITTKAELAELEPELPAGQPNRLERLNGLARALEGMGEDPSAEWNALITDDSLRTSEALAALIEAGQTVLDDWEKSACPLCGAEQDLEALGDSLAQRSRALAEVRASVDAQKARLSERLAEVLSLQEALEEVLGVAPEEEWPRQAELRTAADVLKENGAGLRIARDQFEPAPAATDLGIDLEAALAELRDAADRAQSSPQAVALHKLAALSGQFRRLGEKNAAAGLERRREAAIKALLEDADTKIKSAIEAALAELAELVDHYFTVLMSDPVYSEIKLTYQAKRSGQVEFSVVFDGREPLSPPQRIMSESQLNGLGLALFLARARREEQPWRTLVLDDVVNSFDAPHRRGLLQLLAEEFADWQVIVLSHDSAFRDVAQYQLGESGWTFKEIVAWDPSGGLVLDEGDLLNRLDAALQRGEAASGLAGFARGALEQRLARAVAKLGYRVPYEPRSRHSAAVFLEALRRGLEESDSEQGALTVLERIKVSSYFATLGLHYRPESPDPIRDDLRQVVNDLKDLDAELTCGQCDKPLWFRRPQKRECECGTLVA